MTLPIPYGPNWYASVMGTGIVAVALVGLPYSLFGGATTGIAVAFWIADVLLLVAVTIVMLLHWRAERAIFRRHYDDPVMAHFYGAPAMGLMTVGASTVGVGYHVIGTSASVGLGWMLWSAGTLLGLWTAVGVPYRAITLHDVKDDSATGGWLMPVVPPMVSATTGAALAGRLHGQAQETMLLVCYAFFGLTLVTGVLVLNQIWHRLVRHGALSPTTAPTVWIALGFLGQSITAVHHLGALAPQVVPTYGHALGMLAVCYGVPVWGFTVLWITLSIALTVRQIRAGMPYAPTWWSFTFPVGTVVTGTSALAVATDLDLFKVAAGILMVGLLVGWLIAAFGTARAFGAQSAPATPAAPEHSPSSASDAAVRTVSAR